MTILFGRMEYIYGVWTIYFTVHLSKLFDIINNRLTHMDSDEG
jgi:hypothetical protein